MHKKTPSKNSFKEIRKAGLIERYNQYKPIFKILLVRHPFYFFAAMIVCMLISGVLAFTVMRVNDTVKFPVFPGIPKEGIINKTTNLIGSYGTFLELEELQRSIAVIIQKDSLTENDSTQLRTALKRYELIQRTLMLSVDSPSTP